AILDEVRKQNQEVKTTWHLHDVLVSDDHDVALLEAEQEGRRRRIVHILHLDDAGRIKESWAAFNPAEHPLSRSPRQPVGRQDTMASELSTPLRGRVGADRG